MMEPPRQPTVRPTARPGRAAQRGPAHHRGVRAAAAAWALLLLSACAQQPDARAAPAAGTVEGAPSPAPPTPAATRGPADPVAASRLAVQQLLVTGCSQTADCAAVGVGARSCGGPEAFLAYSRRDTPNPALQAALQRHATLRKKQLEARGEMSTCDVLPVPGVVCTTAGQCQLQPPRGGAAGALLR